MPCSKSPLQIKFPLAPTDCVFPVPAQPPAQHATAATPPGQKKPVGQAAHADAFVDPAGAVAPGAHGTHAALEVAFAAADHVPAPQSVGACEPAGQKAPRGHAKGADAPDGQKLPAGQTEGDAKLAQKEPAGQGAGAPEVQSRPAAQGAQVMRRRRLLLMSPTAMTPAAVTAIP